jgi:hypothetical protein
MQNRKFTAHFAAHWCFNYFSQIKNWAMLKFGQQVKRDIILLHKTFHRNPFRQFGFMIKFVIVGATGNSIAHSVVPSYKSVL